MRSHYCGALGTANIDETVALCGWVDRRRDHGGVIFLDMRDRQGVVQVVFDPDTQEHFERADKVRGRVCTKVTGRVRARGEGTVNPAMATGEIEVLGKELEILNARRRRPSSWMNTPRWARKCGCTTAIWICAAMRCRTG